MKHRGYTFAIFGHIWTAALLLVCLSINTAMAGGSSVTQVPTEAVGIVTALNSSATPAPAAPFQITFALTTSSQSALKDYAGSLTDPSSPSYHHWLTPSQVGQQFGASQTEISDVVSYLSKHGLTNISVWPDRLFITAQTTRQNAESAFGVSIHGYNRLAADVSRGLSATYYAPDRKPSIDGSVVSEISAIFGLSNAVQALPRGSLTGASTPDASAAGYLDPIDLSNAYNTSSLHNKGLEGAGQTIAIYSPTAFQQSDITRFTTANNISSASVNVVNVTGQNGVSGNTSLTDQAEACIDIETVLGQAPAAKVNVYEAPNDGGFEIFQQVEKDDPNILTESYGIDENEVNQAYANAYETIRQAMAAEGITIFVAAGDTGAFDSTNQTTLTVSVDASSGYVTAVGGTELSPLLNNAWNGEVAWTYKDGSTGGNTGSGGGISQYIGEPSWQTGTGVSTKYSDSMRQIPDIAALASKPYYDISTEGGWYGFGGTSCATPLWAGAIALVEESLGTRLGNINPKLYSIAATNASPFHDITSGNDGYYYCTTGWDYVTGWGSADFGKLLTAFGGSTTPPSTTFTIASSPTSVSVALGAKGVSTISLANGSASPSAATLSVSGLPTGVTASFSIASISSTTSSVLSITVGQNAVPGNYTLTITGAATQGSATTTVGLTITYIPVLTTITVSPASVSVVSGSTEQFTATAKDQYGTALATQPSFTWTTTGGGTISSTGLFTAKTTGGPFTVTAASGTVTGGASVTVTSGPSFTITVNPNTLTVKQGSSGLSTLTLTAINGFSGTVSVGISGLPTGVTLGFASSGATATLTFNVGSTAALGSSIITITGTSGSISSTATVTLTVEAPSVLTTIKVSPASASVAAGATEQFTETGYDQYGVALTSQPAMIWSTTGGGQIGSSTGLYTSTTAGGPFTITAANGSVKGTASVTVTPAPSFTISTAASLSVNQGSTGKFTISLTGSNGFNSSAALSISALPAGVTASFSPASASASAPSTLTFTVSPMRTAISFHATITGTSGQLTCSELITLTVVNYQILTSITVSPTSAVLLYNEKQSFTAAAYDQFGTAMVTQPAFTWSLGAGSTGSISSGGSYTAGSSTGTATVVAASGTISGKANVTVQAPVVKSLGLSSASVTGGTSVTGTVTLNEPAPTGGTVVTVASSNIKVASISSTTITVAAGSATGTFSIATVKPSTATTVTISASAGGTTVTTSLKAS
jgi:subtilase family serine protease